MIMKMLLFLKKLKYVLRNNGKLYLEKAIRKYVFVTQIIQNDAKSNFS